MGAIKHICPETVMDLIGEGNSYAEVGRILSCSREQIGRIARAHGHQADRATAGAAASIVPAWAAEVWEDYRDHARLFGEHAAARHCRWLLEEARAAERIAA